MPEKRKPQIKNIVFIANVFNNKYYFIKGFLSPFCLFKTLLLLNNNIFKNEFSFFYLE